MKGRERGIQQESDLCEMRLSSWRWRSGSGSFVLYNTSHAFSLSKLSRCLFPWETNDKASKSLSSDLLCDTPEELYISLLLGCSFCWISFCWNWSPGLLATLHLICDRIRTTFQVAHLMASGQGERELTQKAPPGFIFKAISFYPASCHLFKRSSWPLGFL